MADDHFATWGDAKRFCEKYGVEPSHVDVWDVAEALRRAYEDGQQNPVGQEDDKCQCDVPLSSNVLFTKCLRCKLDLRS
jgi:hypothetical protein